MPTFIIFLTGGVTLALELLSSRILTPYFGVSLYIWTGILCITLACLAIGYFAGGRLTRDAGTDRLAFLYAVLPPLSALAMVAACLVYPWLFPRLAELELVLGSFLAAGILLMVPLVCLSAMNPLLVAMLPVTRGDHGAGRVFFISTVGSVLGVVATAFMLIPNITNFRSVALLAAVLGGLGAAAAVPGVLPLAARARLRVGGLAALATAASVALLATAPGYLDKSGRIVADGVAFTLKAEYASIYGNLKIVEIADERGIGPTVLAFLQDGLIQNRVAADGRSISEYTYYLEHLPLGFVREPRRALVLGLGAGIVPRELARRGVAVDVVEINPDMLAAATAFAAFPGDAVSVHLQDARTFVRRCEAPYDIAVVDLFHGDGTPDYLLTREFFADLRRCMAPDGAVAMNAFFLAGDAAGHQRLLATVRAAFDWVVQFTPYGEGAGLVNSFVLAIPRAPERGGQVRFRTEELPPGLRQTFVDAVRRGRLVPPGSAPPVSDEANVFSLLNARADLAHRRGIAAGLPAAILVN